MSFGIREILVNIGSGNDLLSDDTITWTNFVLLIPKNSYENVILS